MSEAEWEAMFSAMMWPAHYQMFQGHRAELKLQVTQATLHNSQPIAFHDVFVSENSNHHRVSVNAHVAYAEWRAITADPVQTKKTSTRNNLEHDHIILYSLYAPLPHCFIRYCVVKHTPP